MNNIDINLENAKQYLIDESFNRLVVANFWAGGSVPCKNVSLVLEKLSNEHDGAFLLAKVNTDEMDMIAAQFGVRSLPTVMLLQNGQPIDGFAGALPESQVRELLERYLPKIWEKPLADAQALMVAGDYAAALPLLRKAYEESKHLAAIAYTLAACQLELNRFENAEAILATVKLIDQDARYEQLVAQIALKKQAAKSPELIALEVAHASDPGNLDIAYQLAVQHNAEDAYRPALELLIDILRRDRNFAEGGAKKTLMGILTALGKGDPLAIEFQRKLFTLLY